MSPLIPAVGGRRFILSVLTLGACVGLVCGGKIDSGAFSTVVLGTVGVFVGGATYEHRERIRTNGPQPGGPP